LYKNKPTVKNEGNRISLQATYEFRNFEWVQVFPHIVRRMLASPQFIKDHLKPNPFFFTFVFMHVYVY